MCAPGTPLFESSQPHTARCDSWLANGPHGWVAVSDSIGARIIIIKPHLFKPQWAVQMLL